MHVAGSYAALDYPSKVNPQFFPVFSSSDKISTKVL